MSAAEHLFALVKTEIPGYNGLSMGNLDGTGYEADACDLAHVGGHISALARAWHLAWTDLGSAVDFGSNDDLLVSASKGYILIKVAHDRQRFIAVALHADGNIGYLRFRMREYLRRALA